MTDKEYKELLKGRLTPKRYVHSLEVAKEAERLALKYGADPKQAYTAGLLHDILKDTPKEEQLKIAKRFGIILSELEKNAPKLWHSIIGAKFLECELGVKDQEIISAVRYHTTAAPKMTLLERIIYLADYTSLDRDYDGIEEMREAVDKSLEDAMKIALEFTVNELKEKNAAIHPLTLAAYERIKN